MLDECLRDAPVDSAHPAMTPRSLAKCDAQLKALAGLAAVEIETSLSRDLSGNLHSLFDDVCDKALPIYFGPLLGRLYLQGL